MVNFSQLVWNQGAFHVLQICSFSHGKNTRRRPQHSLACRLRIAEQRLSWSPDGKKLALVGSDGLRVSNDGGFHLSEPVEEQAQIVTWFPDSKRIIVVTKGWLRKLGRPGEKCRQRGGCSDQGKRCTIFKSIGKV